MVLVVKVQSAPEFVVKICFEIFANMFTFIKLFWVRCLKTLSVSRLYGVGDGMINEYGTIGGMRISRRNQSTRRKPASVLLFPSQIPQDLVWDRTRVVAWSCEVLFPGSQIEEMGGGGVVAWICHLMLWRWWGSVLLRKLNKSTSGLGRASSVHPTEQFHEISCTYIQKCFKCFALIINM
jgi:hypothetical protein